MEDPAGDAAVAGIEGTASHGEWDLLEAWIARETPDEVQLGLTVDTYSATDVDVRTAYSRKFFLHFTFGSTEFVLDHPGGCGNRAVGLFTALQRLGCYPAEIDDAAGTFGITLPKKLLAQESRHVPREGDAIQGFYVELWDIQNGATGPLVTDRAPDTGVEAYPLRLGLQAPGDLDLWSKTPVRHSNGGAASFLFQANATNRGTQEAWVEFAAESVPDDWEVVVPSKRWIEAGGTATIPVVLTVQSGHAHGDTSYFDLVASDETSEVRLPLGLAFPEIPDPSGHHPRLHFHSREDTNLDPLSGLVPWMNPLDEDPRPHASDEPVQVSPMVRESDGALVWSLDATLNPSLRQGLDFDVAGAGVYIPTFEVPSAVLDARAAAELWHCDPEEKHGDRSDAGCPGSWIRLATSPRTHVGSLDPGLHQLELELEIQAAAEFVPFKDGSKLLLESWLEAPAGGTLMWHLDDTTLDLPLNDYFDPVGFTASGLEIQLEKTRWQANAGQGIPVPFQLLNDGRQPVDVAVSVAGIHAEWVSAPETVRVPAAGLAREELRVQVPPAAAAGEAFDGFLLVEALDGKAGIAIERLRVDVVAEPVESEARDEATKRTPLAPYLPLLAVLVGLRRRR